MGRAARLHKEGVIAGTEAPIRHEREWRPTPRLFLPTPWMKREMRERRLRQRSVTAEKLAELQEGKHEQQG